MLELLHVTQHFLKKSISLQLINEGVLVRSGGLEKIEKLISVEDVYLTPESNLQFPKCIDW